MTRRTLTKLSDLLTVLAFIGAVGALISWGPR